MSGNKIWTYKNIYIYEYNIEGELIERLRIGAARHGHSMEEEARTSPRRVVGGISGAKLLELSESLFSKQYGAAFSIFRA